jgi:glycosyltransferase involved in cell wall biosynthesis
MMTGKHYHRGLPDLRREWAPLSVLEKNNHGKNILKVKIALVTPLSGSGEKGGAEILYQGLVKGLQENGVEADQVKVFINEKSLDGIKRAYLACYDLDLSSYDGVISTRAPSYLVRHPNHICYLLHTIRSFYDMFATEFPQKTKELFKYRKLIHQLDTSALLRPRTKRILTIGHEVSRRLKRWNGLDSRVLHPALPDYRFRCQDFKFLLISSRLHRWKRIDLVIKAMRHVDMDIPLKIAGTGEDERYFKQLAGGDKRIQFLGWVSQRKLLKLYANALAVLFVPLREDFGFVTAEAFASLKPVITCTDSGEPTRLVQNGKTGFICRPTAIAVAKKIKTLASDSVLAKQMGETAGASFRFSSWADVGGYLLKELSLKK